MIKTIYMIFFVCAFSLGLWACAGKQKVEYKNLSSAQFEELIKNPNVQLVDVRTLAEHMEGHIPGSLNINVKDEQFSSCADDLLEKGKDVAVYCRSGRRSKLAAEKLCALGYTNVVEFGGINDWRGATVSG